jgi:hypothetical protein
MMVWCMIWDLDGGMGNEELGVFVPFDLGWIHGPWRWEGLLGIQSVTF